MWAWNFRRGVSPTRRIWSLLKTLAVGLLGATLFVQSTVPYVWRLDRTVLSDIPAKQFGIDVYQVAILKQTNCQLFWTALWGAVLYHFFVWFVCVADDTSR